VIQLNVVFSEDRLCNCIPRNFNAFLKYRKAFVVTGDLPFVIKIVTIIMLS
jgi:hypothetical protein